MKKIIFTFLYLVSLISLAQDASGQWEAYYSFNNIKDITTSSDKIYFSADNAIFSIDIQTNELSEISTVNGLSGGDISSIYYSEVYQLLVVGYEDGLIEIVFDNEEDILSVVDILDKPTIQPTNKRINYITPYQNNVYISTDFGISVFDLERLEFGDTYFIGNAGTQVPVAQTVIFNNFIYAACEGGNGLRKADVTSPNLIDFNSWQVIAPGDFVGVESANNKLYTIRTNNIIYEVQNDVLNQLFRYDNVPVKIGSTDNYLVVTTKSNVFIYDSGFNLVYQPTVSPTLETEFNTATINNDNIYIGTKNFGVLNSLTSDVNSFQEIHPSGPLLNDMFSIEYLNNQLWGVSGGYNFFFNFIGGDKITTGISRLIDDEWSNIPYDYLASEVQSPFYLADITINPFKQEQIFICSYWEGLIEFENDQIQRVFDENNSTIVDFANGWNLTGVSTYDTDGALWVINGRVEKPINRYQNGTWTSFDLSEIIPVPINHLGFSDIVIDRSSGTKFLGSTGHGVIGFNENSGNSLMQSIGTLDQNMPIEYVTALALDNRNQLWIGTIRGLRVLFNTSNFFTEENITVNEIIIEEDGIAKELLFEQYITDIEVDGSNNKWIGTSDSGLFYFSSDGQNTIFHFTKDNSPLPSNSINDVSIDSVNGIVYIATSRGLLSFNSGGSSTFDDLSSAYAYPNPVRPGFNLVDDKVKIKDISENVNIKITDIEGNLVAEAQSRINQRYQGYNLEIDGGTAYWNGKNLANNIVASGVYLIMLSDLDTFETKVLKLMVVR